MDNRIVLSVYLAVVIGALVLGLFFIVRSYWVHLSRMRVMQQDWKLYEKLPSYNYMMRKFWIWNISKFLPPK